MTNTEPLDLDAIEARATAASPGPWDAPASLLAIPCTTVFGRNRTHVLYHSGNHEDADFVAHAREDVPALIAEVRRLREERSTIRVRILDRAYWRIHPHRFATPGHSTPPGVEPSTADTFYAGILRAKTVLADMQAEEALR